jgi:hypothetical protein
LAHRVCIIFSDPLPPQAQTVYEHADRDLIDILTQDIEWTDDGVVAAPPSPRFPMGSAPVSLLMENVCTLASRLMRSSPDDGSLSVKMLRAVIALPLLDGHRHKLVSTILSSDRGLQPLPGQVEFRYMLLDDVLSAASRSECSELLEDARLADARPHHPAVERAILSRAAGVGEIETPSTRRRLV